MTSLFKSPKRPKIGPAVAAEPIEEIEVVEEEAEEAKKRERKRLLTGGRQATILSGIAAALKKRLGE